MKRAHLVLGGLLSAMTAYGCTQESEAIRNSDIEIKSPPVNFGALEKCPNGLMDPHVMYRIVIPDNFDFRKPVVTRTDYPIDANGIPQGNGSDNKPTVYVTNKTRLDLRTDITGKQTGRIQIVLEGTNLTFQQGVGGAVWDPDGKSKLFCDLDVTGNVATFTIRAPDKADKNKISHGHPNIGIVVKDSVAGSGYSLPIFLDPDVENEGVIGP